MDDQTGLSNKEAQELEEALENSRGYDQIILEELKMKKKRSGLKLLWLVSFSACIAISLGLGALSLATGPKQGDSATSSAARPEAQHSLEDLNAVISSLEETLKKPGTGTDYQKLARAYQERYSLTGETDDRKASEKLFIKANSLLSKQHKEDTMFRSPLFFGAIFILVIITVIGLTVMTLYNGLVRTDENVDQQWSQVETVMQRRLDLIPTLVNTVKGYAEHEQSTLQQVMEARSQMLSNLKAVGSSAPKASESLNKIGEAQQSLSLAMGRLLAVVENYPDLKASSNFLSLQDQLEGTENRISVERNRYNTAVKSYNTKLRRFPSNVIASMFGFEARAYFEAKAGAEEPVEVKF